MTDNNGLTPFTITVPQFELDELRDRLARSRWPHPLSGRNDRTDFSRGIPTAYLQGPAGYWRVGFTWTAQEARLNEFNQVTTVIDGQSFDIVNVK